MTKRKFVDTFTGRLPEKGESSLKGNWGGSSQKRKRFYAILESNTYYRTDDDNYANFDGWNDQTPSFDSLEELMDYMNKNDIRLGSIITREVPINDGEHKVYKRVVKLPVTHIEYRFRYEVNMTASVELASVSEETPGDFVPHYKGDFNKLEIEAHKRIIQNLYTNVKSENARKRNGNENIVEFKINPQDIMTLLDILKLEDPEDDIKKEADETIEYLEKKKETVGEKTKPRYDKMIETVKKAVDVKKCCDFFDTIKKNKKIKSIIDKTKNIVKKDNKEKEELD